MTSSAFPVLWLCGPPGVGKSTVGWELFAELDRAGVAAGYVDIDQLAMSFPTTDDDPGRDRMKARNVRAVIANARAAGARCVIVSGVLEVDTVGVYVDQLDEVTLTWCRLRVGRDQITERLARRGWSDGAVEESLQNAESMNGSDFADLSVDTSGLSVLEVAGLVRAGVAWWPAAGGERARDSASPVSSASAAPGPVLWVCGPTRPTIRTTTG
ncbi:MAG TPA: AAA family ATPase [Actinopolymorphaceae bacterium]|jgi:broad-specificity NMP kinase